MGRALVLLLVAAASGLLIYWLAAPRLLSDPNTSAGNHSPSRATNPVPAVSTDGSSSTSHTSPSRSSGNTPGASSAIDAPRTTAQREYDEIERKRDPYYQRLRENMGELLAVVRPAADDQATLELFLPQNDETIVMPALTQAVQLGAYRNGFRRVRLFLLNPPGSLDRYRLDTEATPDEDEVWHSFRK